MYNSIRPAEIWLDTEGKPIQAHGGSVIFINGIYYWYGENKELTDGKNGIWHNGVRCYSSTDLYNWQDCGIIIPAEEDENSSLHRKSFMDRPHIIFNRKTGKYVCWIKIQNKDGTQTMTVLTADSFLGPYKKVKERLRPLGMDSGDFDLAVAPDGKAYIYFDRVHSELICADLTEDYLDVSGYYSTHFPRIAPPYVREGIAHIIREDKHYLFSSGTTGYFPNPSECAVGLSWHGPFELLGNPHIDDKSNTSFHSQISCVFKVEGKKDLYIAVADRWAPDQTDLPYETYAKLFESVFRYHDEEKRKEIAELCDDMHRCTRDSTYVWLPIKFTDGKAIIEWKDEWKIEDYE